MPRRPLADAAVHGRIDWKYALSLELTDSANRSSALSAFHQRLVHAVQNKVLTFGANTG